MYIDGHATENYDASTLKVYASIRITQILGNLTHAQTDFTRPFFPPPQKMASVIRGSCPDPTHNTGEVWRDFLVVLTQLSHDYAHI